MNYDIGKYRHLPRGYKIVIPYFVEPYFRSWRFRGKTYYEMSIFKFVTVTILKSGHGERVRVKL